MPAEFVPLVHVATTRGFASRARAGACWNRTIGQSNAIINWGMPFTVRVLKSAGHGIVQRNMAGEDFLTAAGCGFTRMDGKVDPPSSKALRRAGPHSHDATEDRGQGTAGHAREPLKQSSPRRRFKVKFSASVIPY